MSFIGQVRKNAAWIGGFSALGIPAVYLGRSDPASLLFFAALVVPTLVFMLLECRRLAKLEAREVA